MAQVAVIGSGFVGRAGVWRDRRLIALAAHKRWADKTIGD
jgi:hypothetical protein